MRIFNAMLVIMMLSFIPLSAQRFQGGLLAGITLSQVDGDSYAGYNKLGMQGGVFVKTRFEHNFGAQMEIRYAGRGARKPTSSEDTDIYKLTLHYIDVPLMITYSLKKKVVFDLGIVPGYLFGKKGEDNGGPLPQEFLVDYKSVDIAWLAGVNFLLTKNLMINLRYSYSLLSINDYENTPGNYGPVGNLFGYNNGDYNNYITIGLYYQIY